MAGVVTPPPPKIGDPENAETEFKEPAILGNPDAVIREIVAMLNHQGGTIWIGVEEENGVATRLRHVENARAAATRLKDLALDTIHPRPECGIEAVSAGNVDLIRIMIPRRRKPVHLWKKGDSFSSWVRLSDHIRPLAIEEIIERLRATGETGRVRAAAAAKRYRALRKVFEQERAGRPALWICLAPHGVGEETIDLNSPALKEELMNPRNVNVRPDGWNWAWSVLQRAPRPGRNHLAFGQEDPPCKLLRIHRDGCLTLTESNADILQWRGAEWARSQGIFLLYPYAVVEYPVSLFRLAAWLHKDQRDCELDAHMIFGPAEKTVLSPGCPDTIEYSVFLNQLAKAPLPPSSSRYLTVGPVRVSIHELTENPDHCAFRLTARFYEAFGHSPEKIPFHDPRTNRFAFP